MQASSDNPFVGMFNSNLPTDRSGYRVSGCALEKSVTVGSRLVLLLSAVFVSAGHQVHGKGSPDVKGTRCCPTCLLGVKDMRVRE